MKNQSFTVLTPIIAMVAVCAFGCCAFTQVFNSIWWYTANASPMEISEYTPGGRYSVFLNVSGKTIVEYDFGCVNIVNDKPQLVNIFKTQKLRLKPLSSASELKSVYYAYYHDSCHNVDSRISIVNVLYEDGSRWSVMDGRPVSDHP